VQEVIHAAYGAFYSGLHAALLLSAVMVLVRGPVHLRGSRVERTRGALMTPRHRRVDDVMTASVVTADRLTPYKEIARLLAEHRISGLPVLRAGWAGRRRGVGIRPARRADQAARPGPAPAVSRAPGLTLLAGDLMTAPPVTIGPDATLAAAARLMNARVSQAPGDRHRLPADPHRQPPGPAQRLCAPTRHRARRAAGAWPRSVSPGGVPVSVRTGGDPHRHLG